MQTKDHLALGHFLLKQSGFTFLKRHQRAFLLGCVEPDFNLITYLRRKSGSHRLRGHHAENSCEHMEKCLSVLRENGLRTAWDYFTLGTVLHYAADAFTAPHNSFWKGGLIRHAVYEAELHPLFLQQLRSEGSVWKGETHRFDADGFEACHRDYLCASHNMQTDCRYIIAVCEAVLAQSLPAAYEQV